ncbi:SusD/RagB family nutrient-binding outer membrane lipoprotein [Sinomicrobium oceani]|uniref:SusD/RagB family nutrient-binding outer membrane lipoprotein n=1 Tax=Sinomicrobium oceani TaxID=1150368 RepID=UPI00227C2E5F|nr:SusD/RagB family nutrient-binding outer membrane lipoprotein [Sinomicrobium oceani]
MKKHIHIFFVITLLSLTACDSDFADVNTDPNNADKELFDPNLILPTVSYNYGNLTTGYTGPILFQSMWVQVMASTSTGEANYYSNADKYVMSGSTNSYIQGAWNQGYEAASRIAQMQSLAEEKGMPNLIAVGDIMKVLCLSYVSDIYGDIPYSEALNAEGGTTRPAYDRQQDLYPVMLSDLEAAILAIDPSQDDITNDVFYDGDLDQWKKFGYSLMLKLAMRLVNVNPDLSVEYANKAIAGGVFESANDEAVLPSDETNGYSNSNANALRIVGDLYEVRWSKTMIDYLQATDDPRLAVVAEIPEAGLKANTDISLEGDNTPAQQQGMPNGYDMKGGATDISNEPDYPGGTGSGDDITPIGAYSRPTAIYRNRDATIFVLTYAEVQLLLADAAIRGGYNTTLTAAEYYANGVTGAMQALNKFNGLQVSSEDISEYASANPLDISSDDNALKMINEQLWATTGLLANYNEAWNNWKRSGYPELTPVNYTGNFSNGMIPVRQPYPSTESTTNPENLQQAITNMGGDTWNTRVWWNAE